MGLLNNLGKIAVKAANKIPDVVNALQNQAIKQQSQAMKHMEREINTYEKKLDTAEYLNKDSSAEQKQKFDDAREKINHAKSKIYGTQDESRQKSLAEWDNEWVNIGPLLTANLTPYNNSVGLYRHTIDGKTMYIGRAIELYNGGFRKRLSDYRRDSDSARKHKSGQLIHDNIDYITTHLLIVGNDEDSISITKSLEGQFIGKYSPPWNQMLRS